MAKSWIFDPCRWMIQHLSKWPKNSQLHGLSEKRPTPDRSEFRRSYLLSAGEAVIAAGEAIVTINGNERSCTEITTDSDHYQADVRAKKLVTGF